MDSHDADRLARLTDSDEIGVPEAWNALSYQIIGAAIEVHSLLGAALPEKLYEAAMEFELEKRGMRVDRQRQIRLRYKDLVLPPVVPDMVVNELIIVELKAMERVRDEDLKRQVSYLVAADLPLALLINFHAPRIKDGLFRRINSRCTALQSHRKVSAAANAPPQSHPIRSSLSSPSVNL